MPSRPRSPILRHRSGGKLVVVVDLGGARRDLGGGELLHGRAQHVDRLAEVEIERREVEHRRLRQTIRLAGHHDQRLLHDRAQRALAGALRVDLAARDRQRAARLHHLGLGDQALAGRRRDQVELVLDGQHARVGGKQRESRVAAGRIDDRADDSRRGCSRAAASGRRGTAARSRNSRARARSRRAPISRIAPCRSKLARTRAA